MPGGGGEVAPLFGKFRKLTVSAEVVRLQLRGAAPPFDALSQGAIDILEGGLRGGPGAFCGTLANVVEHPPRLGFFARFVAKESIFQGGVEVGRIEPPGGGELVPRGLGLTRFQVGVGKILAQRGILRRFLYRLKKQLDSGVQAPLPQGVIGLVRKKRQCENAMQDHTI